MARTDILTPAVIWATPSKMGRIRRGLLMPFACKWNGWVRHSTAEIERLGYLLKGGDRGFARRMCRDHGVCLDYRQWRGQA